MLFKLSASARALLLSALVGAPAVALPAAARAQSIAPERALLNRADATPAAAVQPIVAAADDVVDGERALLNHAQTGVLFAVSDDPVMFADAPGVDGVRALLNRASS